MMTDLVLVIAGAAFAAASLWAAARVGLEWWVASTGLVALPLVYAAFALIDGVPAVAAREVAVGLPWIVMGLIALRSRSAIVTRVVGLLWLAHAGYDVIRDVVADPSGAPDWYPAVCLGFDLALGAWILLRLPRKTNRLEPDSL